MAKTKSDKLTAKHVVGYGLGDCGGCVLMVPLWYFMSRYLQVNLQINAGVLATMLLIWNIWDAVNDPMMGTIMDMFYAKSKPGADKFRPWILASIPVQFVGIVAFFMFPHNLGQGAAMVAAVFILKIVAEAGYTMCNIAMGSLLGNMSKNDAERATLSSARGFGSTFAHMLGGILAPQILAKFGTGNEGYAIVAVVFAVIGAIFVFLHYAWTEERNKTVVVKEKTQEEKDAEKFKLTDILNIVKKNRAFLGLVLHSVSVMGVMAMGSGAATYMYIDVLGNVGMQSVASALSSGLQYAILLGAPLLAKKWDLVTIIKVCLLGGAVGMAGLLVYGLTAANMIAIVYVVWFGLASALINMSQQMQWGLVAEAIDYNEYITGKRNEGTIYGFFSLSRRVGQTIANSATVLIIAAIGYNADLTAAGLPQADGTIMGIKILVIGFPMVAALLSFCCFQFLWCINDDVRKKMADWKAAKAGAAE